MEFSRQKWLAKLNKEGKADEILIIINGKSFTPREIAKKELLWIQVVKSI